MIDYLRNKMKAADFENFKRDYELLLCVNQSAFWKESIKLKNSSIYKRKLIETLSNPYEYIAFRFAVYNDADIHQEIQSIMDQECITMGAMMWLHYTIETYLAFVIERVMAQVLTNSCCLVSMNKKLDLYSKVDIRCGNCDLQIKNYSFVQDNRNLPDRLAYYKRHNPNLFFLFYKLHKENVLFAAIDGKPISGISELDCFSVHRKTEFISYQDAADYIISKAAGEDQEILLPQADNKGVS